VTPREREEFRVILRALLMRPLRHRIGPDTEIVDLSRIHKAALHAWFDRELGWQLLVDRDRIRLFKIPADPSYAPGDVPSARQCALYCLLLAVLEDCDHQTVISELVDKITALTVTRPGLRRFDSGRHRERSDLIAMIRMLTRQGALTPTESSAATTEHENAFLHGNGNAIYDIDHRTAALLVSCPVPPTAAADPADLIGQTVTDLGRQRDQRLHHAVMRRLVDQPVLYFDELSEDELAYLQAHRAALLSVLRSDLGVRVETRAEGIAIIDDELTDQVFPGTSTVPFAALLMADLLYREHVWESDLVSEERALQLAAEVAERLGSVVKSIGAQPVTIASTYAAVVRRLHEFGLVVPADGGLRLRPALARYHDPSRRGARTSGGEMLLFGTAEAEPREEGSG
jgi:uncharacterized protein (TIGR02678 family)